VINREGQIIIFSTLDELRVWGPVATREWLKRNRPQGRQLRDTGQVVEFARWHQEAASKGEGAI